MPVPDMDMRCQIASRAHAVSKGQAVAPPPLCVGQRPRVWLWGGRFGFPPDQMTLTASRKRAASSASPVIVTSLSRQDDRCVPQSGKDNAGAVMWLFANERGPVALAAGHRSSTTPRLDPHADQVHMPVVDELPVR
jgi:hypothetical protein